MLKEPLKQILESTRNLWDTDEFRSAVRKNFDKMINCRTLVLGAEVFKSERSALITYLKKALKADVLTSEVSSAELTTVFTTQAKRWWSIHVAHFKSKWQFLR